MSKRTYKDLSPLRDVIKHIFQQKPMKKMFSVKTLANHWAEIVDDNARLHTDVRDLKDGVLFVDVDNPVWSMELKFKEQDIIRILNERCGNNTIHSIVYRTHSLNMATKR